MDPRTPQNLIRISPHNGMLAKLPSSAAPVESVNSFAGYRRSYLAGVLCPYNGRSRFPVGKGLTDNRLLRPDYKEFSRLARESTLVPVVKSVTADLLTPVSAFLAIAAREPDAFLLESVERGEQIGRYTFLGARPYMQVRARGEDVVLQRGRAS